MVDFARPTYVAPIVEITMNIVEQSGVSVPYFGSNSKWLSILICINGKNNRCLSFGFEFPNVLIYVSPFEFLFPPFLVFFFLDFEQISFI